ncbi:unnamed protein product [Phytophthora lilii]|uniref:Unnamed protein product n=1 Tax=Phytophthora lilii TaxID=2077276 RepID=A0A9W6TMI8_9STRA|nr:unnamed protein product [Phytophthora lilii]
MHQAVKEFRGWLIVMCGGRFWPLGCSSLKELFGCALANLIFAAFGLVLLYWTICRELPDVFRVDNTLVKLNVQIDEAQRAAETCHAALLQWERTVAQELCMPVGIDGALLLLNALLFVHFHRRWARYLMVLMAVMFVADVPTKLYDATFPAPEIHRVDPTFAMVDEELLVALDGKNLKPGGTVAWVAYWGCAITSNVDACDKQFVSTFEAGNVLVTFKSLDHFIPCYRDPPNPLKAQEYQCYESVRIRVKDKQSIPGWSKVSPHVSSISRSARRITRALDNDWRDNHETSSSNGGEDLTCPNSKDTTEPTHNKQRMARSTDSSEAVEIDLTATTMASFTPKTDDQSELKKEAVELSRGDLQDNESFPQLRQEAEPRALDAHTTENTLQEVEITPQAETKVLQRSDDLENVSQAEELSLENSKEHVTAPEELQDKPDDAVEIKIVDQLNANSEQELMLDADTLASDGVASDEFPSEVVNEEIHTTTVASEEVELQTVSQPSIQEGHKSTIKLESNHKVQVDGLIPSTTIVPEEQHAVAEDTTTKPQEALSKTQDASHSAAQPEWSNKKRKKSKRKIERRQSTKGSESDMDGANPDSSRSTAAAV